MTSRPPVRFCVVAVAVLAALAWFLGGCAEQSKLYCDLETPCLAGYEYCDTQGVCPASEGHANTCVPEPCWEIDAAVPLPDAAEGNLDAGVDQPVPDAAIVLANRSCVGLSPTCGPDGNENCCANQLVPAGTYYRSYDAASDSYNDMNSPAMVSEFRLDRFAITVGRFRKFVEAGMGTQAQPPVGGSGGHGAIPLSGWTALWNTILAADQSALIAAVKCDPALQSWTDAPGANEHLPMTCINWYTAFAFCIWDGGYLPTEAEWNYAAAGGSEHRAYPWSVPASSTSINSTHAVHAESLTDNVGSRSPNGDGRWGHADLAGNIWEWVLDWHADEFETPCDNCANLDAASDRVMRGGSFEYDASFQRTGYRGYNLPTLRSFRVGARCARAP